MNSPFPRSANEEEIKRLRAQLSNERTRAARLQATLVVEQQKVSQLQQAYNHRDSQAWSQTAIIEQLKLELRAIATTAAMLQGKFLEAQAAQFALAAQTHVSSEHEPLTLSPEAAQRNIEVQATLMDLEQRLQDAVGLVLEELNTRKAAETRIRELEEQLATVRRRIEDGEWPERFVAG